MPTVVRRGPARKRTAGVVVAVLALAVVAGAGCGGDESSSGTQTIRWYVFNEPSGAYDDGIANCNEQARGRYRIEIVDLLVNPALARGDQILAVPTLVRQLPPPVKKIIGDFSNTERVLVGLNLRPVAAPAVRRGP